MRSRPFFNFLAFDDMKKRLEDAGYEAVSPADIDRQHGFNPFTLPPGYDWSVIPPTLNIDEIIDRDIAALRKCSHYVLLGGWENSTGAIGEKGILDWQGAVRLDPVTLKPYSDSDADPTAKPTNPKDVIGSNKLPFHLWPETASALGCLALLDGALKYGRSNFRSIGVRASIYYDACRRHINKWFEGQDVDEDSGLPHLAHALACLAIVVDAQAAGKLTDDRMHPGGYARLVDELTPHVKRLKEKYADRHPKHYTLTSSPA